MPYDNWIQAYTMVEVEISSDMGDGKLFFTTFVLGARIDCCWLNGCILNAARCTWIELSCLM